MSDIMPASPGDTNPTARPGSVRDDILAGLRIAEAGSVGDETPEELLDRYRAEVEAAQLRKTADLLIYINPDRSADFSEGVDWAADELRRVASEAGLRRGDPR